MILYGAAHRTLRLYALLELVQSSHESMNTNYRSVSQPHREAAADKSRDYLFLYPGIGYIILDRSLQRTLGDISGPIDCIFSESTSTASSIFYLSFHPSSLSALEPS